MKQENAGQADLSCIFVLRKHGLGKGRVASWMKRIRKKRDTEEAEMHSQTICSWKSCNLSGNPLFCRRRDSGDVYPEDVEGKSRRLTDGKRVIANIPRFFFRETCKQTAREIFSQKMCNQIGGFYWLKGADSGRCVIKSV